jgi:hypothetical protein
VSSVVVRKRKVRRPGLEADGSHPFISELKNEHSCRCTSAKCRNVTDGPSKYVNTLRGFIQ